MPRVRLFLLALPALFAIACQHHEHPHEAPGKLVVSTPLRKDTSLSHEYVAQLRAIQHIELRALERGYLEGIYVDEGQRVEKNQRMFQIMPLIYQVEVQKAKAEADRSRIEYNNTKSLADKGVVSPNELALARANYAKAQAELALASAHKGLTEIHAPFSGVMGRFGARLGSLIAEGDLLSTLSDTSTMWAYFNVPEASYLEGEIGLRLPAPASPAVKGEGLPLDLPAAPTAGNDTGKPVVQLKMANGKLFENQGRIQTMEADFNTETGTIAFRAAFPNPKGLLRHGETGKVVLQVPIPKAILIPQKATFDVLDKKYVFVVDAKNIVHARPIEVAAELPQLYVISSGLTEQDHILLDGLRKVHDGSEIVPDFKPANEVFGHLNAPAE